MARRPFHPEQYLSGARDLFSTVLARSGVVVHDVTVRQVQARPSRSVTMQCEVSTVAANGDRRTTLATVRAARTALPGLDPVALDADGHPICILTGFDDPKLPGLLAATDPERVRNLFVALGIGDPQDTVELRVRAHRPLRRAVVEATGPAGRIFLKVVPPAQAPELHRRHRLLTDAGVPVAPSIGWTDDGIVALGAISGRTLRQDLDAGAATPPLREVHDVVDRFPTAIRDFAGPADPISRLPEHAEFLGMVLPDAVPRLERLVGDLTELARDGVGSQADGPDAVHGDLYEAQIMTGGGRVRGLIDVDGVGRGHRINDDANMIGHLAVYDLIAPHAHARRLGAEWTRELDLSGRHDPVELRARVAAVIVGLATGPFRVQQRDWERATHERLDLADIWSRSALRARSRPSHVLHPHRLSATAAA